MQTNFVGTSSMYVVTVEDHFSAKSGASNECLFTIRPHLNSPRNKLHLTSNESGGYTENIIRDEAKIIAIIN